ncbi:pre-mRNA-splicing regulator female-lethal(2)D isoform X2 [Episyrphus balteatus]|uniref:pre-mRNA-splicing regulator female-lethal(2)D isoform X2 n=1 Tax=Episyrphus balteatus TaxID=286459 RepID=UPI002486C789|nr:pre-mRNA-splicing regulator female-lethal(2)D isoform X2 [Episyrphus balteatus]
MSVVAASATAAKILDEQKTILKTCGSAAAAAGADHNNSISDNNDENHVLHKLNTAPSSTTSATTIGSNEGGSVVLHPPASQIISNNNFSSTSTLLATTSAATETIYTAQHRRLLEEIHSLKIEQSRVQQQFIDAQRREKILMRRLANKEQEFQDYVSQIAEYKAAQAPGPAALRTALLDPAVNLLFEKLKKELQATKAKLEDTQQELSAWKFTPDSNTGKRLMAKCRLLYQENEELGKMTSNGRLAKLETELAMQKSFAEEVKKSQSELDDFLQELDEDVEGMQSTILFLQQELKTTRDRIQFLEKENYQLKNGITDETTDITVASSPSAQQQHLSMNGAAIKGSISLKSSTNYSPPSITSSTNTKFVPSANFNILSGSNLETIEENSCLRTQNPNFNSNSGNKTLGSASSSEFFNGASSNDANGNYSELTQPVSANSDDLIIDASSNSNSAVGGITVKTRLNSRKRNFDSDSSECGSTNGTITRNAVVKKSKKKTRRSSSVLSIDLNEDDSHIGGDSVDRSDDENSNSQPTRVMTRRKSARNHHNGGESNI